MDLNRMKKLAGLLKEGINEALPPKSVKNDPKKVSDVKNLIANHSKSKKTLMAQIEKIKQELKKNDESLEGELNKILGSGKPGIDTGILYKTPGSTDREISLLHSIRQIQTDFTNGRTNIRVNTSRFHPVGDYSTPEKRAQAVTRFNSELDGFYKDLFKK